MKKVIKLVLTVAILCGFYANAEAFLRNDLNYQRGVVLQKYSDSKTILFKKDGGDSVEYTLNDDQFNNVNANTRYMVIYDTTKKFVRKVNPIK